MSRFLPNGASGGGGGGFNPPSGGGSGAGKGAIVSSLLTSTGGLTGTFGSLMTPAFDPITGKIYIITHDPSNFDCEEDAEYDYNQVVPPKYEGRDLTINQIILKYREIGKAKFNVNITVFKKELDDFVTTSILVNIPVKPITTNSRKKSFPDGRIHTVRLAPPNGVLQGERPQISYTRKADSGPFSITTVVLCGYMDEAPFA